MNDDYPSQILGRAVEAFAQLPGVGRKTALRLALHTLRQDESYARNFAESLIALKSDIKYCRVCHNLSDTELCCICADGSRDRSLVCVVQNIQDVMAVEHTMQYRGVYHVLGGIISPIDGIGPKELNIDSLISRVEAGGAKEVILALSPTPAGETTNFYITRKLTPLNVLISTIAKGVSVGEELEYSDEITLGRSIVNRTYINK